MTTVSYESLGLCKEGEGHLLIEKGDTTYGGKWLVNPSGGLISKGHPRKCYFQVINERHHVLTSSRY